MATPSWRDLNKRVADGALYPYMVRLAVLAYRTQPRFREDLAEDGGTLSQSSTHSQPGTSLLVPTATSTPPPTALSSTDAPQFQSKMPKDIPKLLQTKFKDMALKPDPALDPLLRRSYLSFYAQLLEPEFYRRVKESRRAEELVLMFLSCVAKDLKRNAEFNPADTTDTVDRHAAAFVKLLITCVKESSAGHRECASLLAQLQVYEESLLKNKVVAKSSARPLSGVGLSALANSSPLVPTFTLEDIPLAHETARLLLVANSELKRDLAQCEKTATEAAIVAELRHIANDLNTYNRHPVYSKLDFASDAAFDAWRARELDSLNGLIDHYVMCRPSTTTAVEASATAVNYFIPDDPKSYFRHLLKRCLERDLNSAGKELQANPESITVLLSKTSTTLLQEAATLWRLSPETRAVLLLDVAQELFHRNAFELTHVYDSFSLAHYLVAVVGKRGEWNPAQWAAESDRVLLVTALAAIKDATVDIITELLTHIYEPSPPKLGPYLQMLDEHVKRDLSLLQPPVSLDSLSLSNRKVSRKSVPAPTALMISPKQLHALEQSIITAAESKYDALIDEIPRDHTLDPLHVTDLADKIIALSKKLHNRYKHALFDIVTIPALCTERHLLLFAADSKSMVLHFLSHIQAKNEEPAFEDMMTLYRKLGEIRSLLSQVSPEPFGFDIEATFYPFVAQWTQSSAQLAQSWVEPAVQADKFEPNDPEHGVLYSSSVQDVFTSFRSAISLIRELEWQNQVHEAVFYMTLMKGVSLAVAQYASSVFDLFLTELQGPTQDSASQQPLPTGTREAWLNMAKNAVSGNRTPQLTPHKFLRQTCVKLNNIEMAQIELDRLETTLDSERLHRVMAEHELSHRKPSHFLFTVKVVQAEGLKACDMNGLSDPYVTLVDQKTRASVGKTRTIYADLNPYWDETFEVTTAGPKWLTTTVWDENTLGNHDVCGRAFIRLDPAAFQDFVSQDYWLDLDTQGRLLVNISMESEREDIRFYFGKAMRTLVRTENDMVRLIVSKFTDFIEASLSRATMRTLLGSGSRFGMDQMSNWLNAARNGHSHSHSGSGTGAKSQAEIEDSLNPLFDYLNDNFSTLARVLTDELRLNVMTQTWKVVLKTVDNLLLPPLNDKRTSQSQISATEADIVFTWLTALRDFFHHDGAGPSLEVLQSQKYQELMTVPVYYDLSTQSLKEESEKMSSLSFKGLQERNYFAIPEMVKRNNTVLAHRNRTVVKRQREQLQNARRDTPQTEDTILRILKARGEFDYVVRRLKQRERMAQTLATESLVRKVFNKD